MVCLSYGVLAVCLIGLFLFGVCVGGLVIYKIEEDNFKAMTEQCESICEEEERLRCEREEYYKTRDIIDEIDDLPEYLRGKYYISDTNTFTDSDEDLTEVYV